MAAPIAGLAVPNRRLRQQFVDKTEVGHSDDLQRIETAGCDVYGAFGHARLTSPAHPDLGLGSAFDLFLPLGVEVQ